MNATLKKIIRKRQKPDGSVILTPTDVEAILNDEDAVFERFTSCGFSVLLASPREKQKKG
jgi:hypothetical protein